MTAEAFSYQAWGAKEVVRKQLAYGDRCVLWSKPISSMRKTSSMGHFPSVVRSGRRRKDWRVPNDEERENSE